MTISENIVIDAKNQARSALRQLERDVRQTAGAMEKDFAGGAEKAGKSTDMLGKFLEKMVVGGLLLKGAQMMVQFGKESVQVASDVNEAMSKAQVVFGDFFDETSRELEEYGDTINRSKYSLLEYAATFQDTFVPLGFARDEAAKLSIQLTKLTSDLSSFNNAAEPETANLLTSALVGNHEAVRRYGIVLTEATLKEELARMGAEDLTGAALEQAKVQARLNIIMASTSDAHGDAARTADQYANASRGLDEAMKDLQVTIGSELLPTLALLKKESAENLRGIDAFANMTFQLRDAWKEGNMTYLEAIALQAQVRLTAMTAEDVLQMLADAEEEAAAEAAQMAEDAAVADKSMLALAQSGYSVEYSMQAQRDALREGRRQQAAYVHALEERKRIERELQAEIDRTNMLQAGLSAGLRAELLGAVETLASGTEELQQREAELNEELNKAEKRYGQNSKQVKELAGQLEEVKQEQLDLANATSEAIAQMVFQQAAAGLDEEAALGLARSMGILSEQDYAVASAVEALRQAYDANRDGAISAAEGAMEFANNVDLVYQAADQLVSAGIDVTQENLAEAVELINAGFEVTPELLGDVEEGLTGVGEKAGTAAGDVTTAMGEAESAAKTVSDDALPGVQREMEMVGQVAETEKGSVVGFLQSFTDNKAKATVPLNEIKGKLDMIQDKTVTVTVIYREVGNIPRQKGGPVIPGLPYLVHQDEVIVSPQPGYVIPASESRAMQAAPITPLTGPAMGAGGGGGDVYYKQIIQQNFYNEAAAALGLALVARSKRSRLNASMGG